MRTPLSNAAPRAAHSALTATVLATRPRPGRRVTMHATSLAERDNWVHMLHSYQFFIELILIGDLQRYAVRAQNAMRQAGLYRQQAKKQMNELMAVANDLQRRVGKHLAINTTRHITNLLPAYADAYYADGGGMTARLQSNFWRITGDVTNHIYLSNKQMLDKLRTPHSEMCAALMTANAISVTGREAISCISGIQDRLLAGDVVLHHVNSTHHERVTHLTDGLLIHYVDLEQIKARCANELGQTREFIRRMQHSLSGDSLCQLVTNSMKCIIMEYVEFCLASLAIGLQTKDTLPAGVQESVTQILGSHEETERLFNELRHIDLHPDEDVWDLSDRLPDGDVDSAIFVFRRRYVTHFDYVEPEKKEILKNILQSGGVGTSLQEEEREQ